MTVVLLLRGIIELLKSTIDPETAVSRASRSGQHLLMVGCDEPQFHVHVTSSPLCSYELQHILMSHSI